MIVACDCRAPIEDSAEVRAILEHFRQVFPCPLPIDYRLLSVVLNEDPSLEC